MLSTYTWPKFPATRPPELDAKALTHKAVVIVGAGPVGLALAIDLAMQGHTPVVLDDDDTVSVGSRGVCYAKRTLEILDRLGVGDGVVAKGVTWNIGRTFFGEREVYQFNLLPDADHKRPGMVNLQQYYLEEYLLDRARELGVELRFRNKVTDVQQRADEAVITVETPFGTYSMRADWLVAADGARSPIRRLLGLEIEGKVFTDRFLIADVVMKSPRFLNGAAERWFWFDPPFHRNQSVLLHRQADDVWRVDFQLGWQADPDEEKKPERVIPRIKAMLSHGAAPGEPAPEFELEWVSVYTFQCRRMAKFRHGRVLFIGDAAHQVSPFGARGANSGIQDADNLAWKLAAVLDGRGGDALLDSYSDERVQAADENIRNSTRSTDFITPKSAASLQLRTAVLQLAQHAPFARKLVNSGRLSVPCYLADSALNTPDQAHFECPLVPGAPMDDAPLQTEAGAAAWLLDQLDARFHLLLFVHGAQEINRVALAALADRPGSKLAVHVVTPARLADLDLPQRIDARGVLARRCDARPGTVYLLRPDQHVAARWRALEVDAVRAALERALSNTATSSTRIAA
jgi:3-(3-hydroxy-phenyl)propionate hydroxylase